MAEATAEKPRTATKFTIEFATDQNQAVTVSTLNEKFRGRWSRMNVKPSQSSEALATMPDIPGIYMEVDVRSGKVRTYDPLEVDPSTLAQVNAARKRQGIHDVADYTYVESSERTLDEDQLKTLLVEIDRMLHCTKRVGSKVVPIPKCVVVSGKVPTRQEIEKMAGRELCDPLNDTFAKPHYADQQAEFRKRLTHGSIL